MTTRERPFNIKNKDTKIKMCLLRFATIIMNTSCVANYIIARSMKEGKGSQCQEGQGSYQEPKEAHN